MDDKTAEKVRQQVLGGKTNRNTAHAAEGQYPRNAVAHGLHGNEHGRNEDNGPGQFAHRVDGGVVHGLFHFQRRYENPLRFFDQSQNRPDQYEDETNLQHRLIGLEDLRFRVFVSHFGSPIDPLQPDKGDHRLASRMQQGIVEQVFGLAEFALKSRNYMAGNVGDRGRSKNQRKDNNSDTPGFRQQPEILDPAIHHGHNIPDHRIPLV